MSKPELAVASTRVKLETDLLESKCKNTKNMWLGKIKSRPRYT